MRQHLLDPPPIAGFVTPEFEAVRHEFVRNFLERGEQGAACTIFHRGVKVVDLWGGYRCTKTASPWTKQTLCLAFSVTKGMAAAAMAVAHSQGLFELDECVATYWPEFAQNGKEQITVRELLAHQAGLTSVDQRLRTQDLANPTLIAEIIARQKPQWKPGSRHGYHTLTLGWYQSELIRRTDPRRRTLGQFFQQEIAEPLGISFFIGLPPNVRPEEMSVIQGFHRIKMLSHLHELPLAMVVAAAWPNSLVAQSVRCLRLDNPADLASTAYQTVEIPSANGIGQARAVARVYDILARGGAELGINKATWKELVAPAIQPEQGTRDAILKTETRYGFGFSRPSNDLSFGADQTSFGCPGAGGSFGMADPTEQLGIAYITQKMGFRLFDDPREKAVRDACYTSLPHVGEKRRAG